MSRLFCYWKILCPVICFLNLFPFTMLLVRFYKVKYHKSFSSTMLILLEEKKFYILMITILTNLVVLFVNVIHIDKNDHGLNMMKQQFSILEQVLIFSGYYLVIYYIFKKSSKGLDKTDRTRWIKLVLKPIICFAIFVNICIALALESDTI